LRDVNIAIRFRVRLGAVASSIYVFVPLIAPVQLLFFVITTFGGFQLNKAGDGESLLSILYVVISTRTLKVWNSMLTCSEFIVFVRACGIGRLRYLKEIWMKRMVSFANR
jgi:hypothetical protein